MGRTAAKLNRSASSASDRPGDEMTAYSSLAEKRWGDFAFEGFSAPDTSKLAFDLRENERKARNRKRETRDWTDFSSQGFTGDDSLQVALDFDDGLKEDMERWPGERAQLLERLRQAQKNLPNFPYDISPRVLTSPSLAGDPSGQRTIHPISNMDEAFADVWADYLLGSGWSNRDELTHRTANFVVLQYKSKPTASSASAQDQGAQANLPTSSAVPRRTEFGETVPPDPRIDAAWFIVQEIVPPQYRAELESAGRSQGKSKPMLRKLNVFKNLRKDKSATSPILDPWGQDVFRPGAGGTTKQIRLGDPALLSSPSEGGRPSNASIQSYHGFQGRRENVPPLPPLPRQFAEENVPVRSSHDSSHSYFRSDGGSGGGLFSTLRAKSRKGRGYKKRGDGFDPPKSPTPPVPPKLPMAAEYSMQTYNSMDFETRSLHEDAAEHGATPTGAGKRRHPLTKHAHGQSKDDAWVDIMFKANEGRLANQDALPSTPMDRRVVSEGMEPSGLVGRETRQKGIPIAPEEDDEVEARAQDVDIPTPPTERDETPPPPLPKSAGLPPEPSETESDFRPVSSGMYPGPSLESRPETPRITREGEQLEYLDSPELRHAELAASSSGHSSQAHGSVHYRPDSALLPPSSEIGLDEERDRERMADREAYSRAESRVPDEIGHGQSLSPSNPASATGAAAASATSGGDSDADGRRNSGSSSSDDDGEPPRIESAQLVRALRASLAPVDTRKAQRDSGLRFGGSASPSSSLTGTPNRPARENPFLKDRTAGRVASLAGKFGGGAPVARSPRSPNGFDKDKALPLSPQTTGNSSVSAGLPVGASAFSTGLSPSASGASAGAGLGAGAGASASVPRRTENVLPPLPLEPVSPTSETRRSIQSGNTSPIYETQLAKASLLLPNAAVAATSSDPSQIAYSVGAGAGSGAGLRDGMPMEPGMETEVRDMEMSTDAGSVLGADEIEIYPDDAASNFSRETRSSQDSFDPDAASKQWPSSSSYANANNTHQFRLGSASGAPGARAGAGVGAGENGSNGNFGFLGEMGGRNSIATSSGASGDEEEMVPMPMTLHQFREPYQPGMPLDNVAEESESVLSGA